FDFTALDEKNGITSISLREYVFVHLVVEAGRRGAIHVAKNSYGGNVTNSSAIRHRHSLLRIVKCPVVRPKYVVCLAKPGSIPSFCISSICQRSVEHSFSAE